jgi:alkanesulfonate monooxygenase SsuD/methylene tetrahydromethanopterin reductase-like flavin-dependent oxidoreductase (luciferase family)
MTTIQFGLGMRSRPSRAVLARWLSDLETSLPKLVNDYDSLWISDHFFWEDIPTMECWTALSFMAARWPTFKIGPMVLGQSYRNPAMLAKMAATLQFLSGGRLVMGLGAGWKEDEYHAYDYPFPSAGVRLAQLEDTLEILKRLWTQPGKVTYEGKHYRIKEAFLEPKPDPAPPIMIGGSGDRLLHIAARYADWWNLTECTLDRYTDRARALKAQCEKVGRDPSSIKLTWWGRLHVGRTEADALKLGEGVWTRDNALVGTPAQVVEQMQGFAAAGVTYFMTMIPTLPDPEAIAMVTEEVLPKVRNFTVG